MKLYNRQEFLALPAGVVFAKYEPHCFEQWQIKGDTVTPNDFRYQPFIDVGGEDQELWEAYEELDENKNVKVDFYSWYKDGLYEDDMLFAVLEKHEVCGLIERLEQTLVDGYVNTIS